MSIWQWLFGRHKRARLICMRYADMLIVHPQQVIKTCCQCGEAVGVYPSGQKVLATHRNVEIVCHICADPDAFSMPAPGALDEIGQGRRKPRDSS